VKTELLAFLEGNLSMKNSEFANLAKHLAWNATGRNLINASLVKKITTYSLQTIYSLMNF